MNDLDYYSNQSDHLVHGDVEHEDFPVNNAQPPDYAPKLNNNKVTGHQTRYKNELHQTNVRRMTAQQSPNMIQVRQQTHGLSKKLAVSSTDLNKLDDHNFNNSHHSHSMGTYNRKPKLVRDHLNKIKKSESQTNLSKETNNNNNLKTRNIPVQFITKPVRSKTSIDMKRSATSSSTTTSSMTTTVVTKTAMSQQSSTAVCLFYFFR